MNKSIEQRFRPLEVRARQEERIIEGYAVVFDSIGNPSPYFTESVSRDAFSNCDYSKCICCFNHDRSKVVARTSAGNLKLNLDDKGLFFEATVPNTQVGNDLLENIRVGNIQGCSFAFTISGEEWKWGDAKTGEPDHRTITGIDHLYDVSPVIDPAYNDTTVAQRSIDEHYAEVKAAEEAAKIKASELERERKLKEIQLHK